MDAMKFVEELHRMCKTYVGCFECPAKDSDIIGVDLVLLEEMKQQNKLN